jgi:hypothetical protein
MTGLVEMPLAELLARWRPGSHDTADTPDGADRAWTWADEAHDLATRSPDYQAGVVERVHREGAGFLDDAGGPILLGNDGRVWDGHHRICAALTLGLQTVRVDVVRPEPAVFLPNGIQATAVKVACINWGHPDAPHAVAYVLGADGSAYCEVYGSWPAAMDYARRLRAALGAKARCRA